MMDSELEKRAKEWGRLEYYAEPYEIITDDYEYDFLVKIYNPYVDGDEDGQRVRDIYRAKYAGLNTSAKVALEITGLEDWGWVRRVKPPRSGRGPSPEIFEIHPAARK